MEEIFNFKRFPQFKEFRELAFSVLEGKYLDELIKRSCGSATEATRLSGTSRARLYQLLKKHDKSLKEWT